MAECSLVQHLKRISKGRVATDPVMTNIAVAIRIAVSAIRIVDDIRESRISEKNINYLVDLLPAIYELDDPDLLRIHLEIDDPDCLICAAIKTRLAHDTGSAAA